MSMSYHVLAVINLSTALALLSFLAPSRAVDSFKPYQASSCSEASSTLKCDSDGRSESLLHYRSGPTTTHIQKPLPCTISVKSSGFLLSARLPLSQQKAWADSLKAHEHIQLSSRHGLSVPEGEYLGDELTGSAFQADSGRTAPSTLGIPNSTSQRRSRPLAPGAKAKPASEILIFR